MGGDWSCPVCGGHARTPAFRRPTDAARGIAAGDLVPTSTSFGDTLGPVVRCDDCGHGSLDPAPSPEVLSVGYEHAADDATVAEEPGRRATARRDLDRLGAHLGPDRRRLLDVGCWTGALVAEAAGGGWQAEGVEPSAWAVGQACDAGLTVRRGSLDDLDPSSGPFQVVTCCDVVEHLVDPLGALRRLVDLLEPGGLAFVTVPDAGSRVARALGSRWWSVLPMHVQYFTRASLLRLLRRAGFEVVGSSTHPKVFTRRYYADRLGAFVPVLGPPAARAFGRLPGADRPFAPDFGDRLAVIARRPEATTPA